MQNTPAISYVILRTIYHHYSQCEILSLDMPCPFATVATTEAQKNTANTPVYTSRADGNWGGCTGGISSIPLSQGVPGSL